MVFGRRLALASVAALGLGASSNVGTVESTSLSASASVSSSSSSGFQAVRAIHVRVQGDEPLWDKDNKVFVSSYYSTFDTQYRGLVDTVNMAAVEGGLKYVQAECINASVVTNCARKSSVKYVVFYETTIVQPQAAIDFYEYNFTVDHALEHCPFAPMDSGMCDVIDGAYPDVCQHYTGANGTDSLGFCVSSTLQEDDPLALYKNNYWYSYPNSCPYDKWSAKTDSCREEQAGGLCDLGVSPDGKTCSFSYKVLGYIPLDDVVGITSMVNPYTNETYANYSEFCQAGGIEYEVVLKDDDTLDVVTTIPFWENPGSYEANAKRITTMVQMYQDMVGATTFDASTGLMYAIPTVEELVAANPPCYVNSETCAKAEFGCSRDLYSQLCFVCESTDSSCVINPDLASTSSSGSIALSSSDSASDVYGAEPSVSVSSSDSASDAYDVESSASASTASAAYDSDSSASASTGSATFTSSLSASASTDPATQASQASVAGESDYQASSMGSFSAGSPSKCKSQL